MARTALTVSTLGRDGASLTTVSADVANGNLFRMPQVAIPEVLCSFFSITGGTVTVHSNQMVDSDLSVADRVLTLPVATVFLWLCPGAPYIQTDGGVWLDFSAATSIGLLAV